MKWLNRCIGLQEQQKNKTVMQGNILEDQIYDDDDNHEAMEEDTHTTYYEKDVNTKFGISTIWYVNSGINCNGVICFLPCS